MGKRSGREVVARRYDRLAWLYDAYNAPMEISGVRTMRRRLLSQARGLVLEVGIGTGRNLDHYPPEVRVVGIDIAQRMLDRARRTAERLGREVRLEQSDVQRLPFADRSFDTAVATCVFCSVPDPVAGLRELRRVVKPDGQVLLVEHVRPRGWLLGRLSDVVSWATRRMFGFNANRRTEDNVVAAGFEILDVRRHGVWREIVARPAAAAG
ncbi:MAG: class I SAM-dependent methyltransferase [Actinomycetota bacterium]